MVNVQQLIYLHIFDSRNQNLFEIYLKSIFEAYLFKINYVLNEVRKNGNIGKWEIK